MISCVIISLCGYERILLIENGEIVPDEDQTKIFNNFYNTITDSLEIPSIPTVQICDSLDPIDSAILKYSTHLSINKIESIASEIS